MTRPDAAPALPDVAVLCGGLGTRLQPVVADRPKALAEVAGRPFLAWLLDALAAQGFARAVLCTGHRAGQIAAAFGDRHGRLSLAYSQESTPLGTGGALGLAAPLLHSHQVLVLNGDSYVQADLAAFVARHRQALGQPDQASPARPVRQACPASMLLTHVADTRRYGAVQLDRHDRVTGFVEKAAAGGAGWVNAGVYLFERGVLDRRPAGSAWSLEHDLLPQLVAAGLQGQRCEGGFIDIGTPASYAAAAGFLARTVSTP